MKTENNSAFLASVIKALYAVAGRRTSEKFADDTIGATIRTLMGKYDFLKHVKIQTQQFPNDVDISVSSDVNTIEPKQLGKAIESIIRMVYNDLNEEAGLYFITELKECAGERVTSWIYHSNVDLDQIQIEQHHLYRTRERRKSVAKNRDSGEELSSSMNPLGYTWSQVASWRHDSASPYCVLYDKSGKVIDRLNLDRIIQGYVERLSGQSDSPPEEMVQEASILEKDYELLELMYSRDMDIETAATLLEVSEEDLNEMIRRLTRKEMVQFSSFDTVELTDAGISYLQKSQPEKKHHK